MRSAGKSSARTLIVIGAIILSGWGTAQNTKPPAPKPSLKQALENLKVPPDWFNSVTIFYDLNKPWKDARLEVRRLLGLGTLEGYRQAIKITYLYAHKKDIGNGHELPMYLFMGGEFAWAIQEYPKFLAATKDPDAHARVCFAACYRHFGEYDKALEVLNEALKNLPAPPWAIMNEANLYDAMGDVYADMGKDAEARQYWEKAATLYPTSNQPTGRAELHRKAAKVRAKIELLDRRRIETGHFRDGVYTGKSYGYAGEIEVTVIIQDGKIADIQLKHDEKIDLGATILVPREMIAKQNIKVDNITGATVTCQAIEDGVFQALKKAGLK